MTRIYRRISHNIITVQDRMTKVCIASFEGGGSVLCPCPLPSWHRRAGWHQAADDCCAYCTGKDSALMHIVWVITSATKSGHYTVAGRCRGTWRPMAAFIRQQLGAPTYVAVQAPNSHSLYLFFLLWMMTLCGTAKTGQNLKQLSPIEVKVSYCHLRQLSILTCVFNANIFS